jgi:predicted acyl esterase
MQVRHPEQPARPLKADEWPLPKTQWTRIYLDPLTHSLQEQLPGGGASSVSFGASSEGVTFVTAPLPREITIIGPSAAKLRVSTSTNDADLFLILRVFGSDFKEITYAGANDPHSPIAHGWLRASSRKADPNRSLPYRPYHTHDEIQPLIADNIYELDVEIWPTCIVVPTGYRIALTVRGKDYIYPGDLSGSPGKIGQPATGVGPFRHTDPTDRPPSITEATITLHFELEQSNYILLPIVQGVSKH